MTNQQYITEQFVGKNKELDKIKDDIYKTLKENWNEKLGYVPEKPMALITVHNPHSSIIESIGYSEPNDLILDNFGSWFAGTYGPGTINLRGMVDENGSSRFLPVQNSTSVVFNITGGLFLGVQFQIGRGGGVFARSDFNLNDPFVVAPESNKFAITPGGWISGNQTVVVNGLIQPTSSDTIGECGIWGQWFSTSPSQSQVQILLAHDIAGASFVGGQNVNVTYTWSIT